MGWFNRKNKKIKEDREFRKLERELEMLRIRAKEREQALDYRGAAKIWDQLGEISEAARVRRIMLNENKVEQTVVHGDYVDDRDTIVKDSVINRSNVGAGDNKFTKLKELTEMKEKGFIDDDEFKQMKKEILGK
jgi:hypothetical protein